LVLDESHKLASPTSKTSKWIRKFAKSIPHRILLTGTPIRNSYMDLWAQLDCVHPGSMLPSWYDFRSRFAIMPVPGIPMIKGWRNPTEIMNMAKPWMLSVDKAEVQKNLPPLTVTDIHVELSPKERKAYEQIRDELRLELDNGEEMTVQNLLVKTGRLRQCCGGLYHFGIDAPSAKLSAVSDLLDSLGSEKSILFCHYATTAKYVCEKLGIRHCITGETTNRDEVLADWRKCGTVLVGTSALESGINAQEAGAVIIWESPWTHAAYEQEVGRAWRQGRVDPVTVYRLLADDTLDMGIWKLIERKKTMGDFAQGMTRSDIASLLQ
jgi:SNF2 family DNA or RNA helicase